MELKDGLLDFACQTGQTHQNYLPQLWVVGGDGLTYQKMLELKRYLQFHRDLFQSFTLLQPLLLWWHLLWTFLCLIFETHWGNDLTKDPSSLGHSAKKIGRAKPLNLKKVDYYPSMQLSYLVLDIRMLDCWR